MTGRNPTFSYCPRCGERLREKDVHGQITLACQRPTCGFIFWQNSKLCVTAVIADKKGRVLLTRRNIQPDKGKLDLPGGFLQAGELPEAGARREVEEEIGLRIELTGFLGHFADKYWYQGMSDHIITASFAARIRAGEPRVADRREIEEIVWLRPEHIAPSELAFDGNEKMLRSWRQKQGNRL